MIDEWQKDEDRLRTIERTGLLDRGAAVEFDPLIRLASRAIQGTGLGLATVYGLVRKAGGLIELQSAPGEGARFDILLPRLGSGGPDRSGSDAA